MSCVVVVYGLWCGVWMVYGWCMDGVVVESDAVLVYLFKAEFYCTPHGQTWSNMVKPTQMDIQYDRFVRTTDAAHEVCFWWCSRCFVLVV